MKALCTSLVLMGVISAVASPVKTAEQVDHKKTKPKTGRTHQTRAQTQVIEEVVVTAPRITAKVNVPPKIDKGTRTHPSIPER